ncbi:outer membrane receptor protein involved in Fe transport [Neolewinella xylanilytica]|uniref:Outer membrane receptor protein involved in Fe transport n=1 Tax=Neolewinella xylanilytica TaxID=1514080 RepID=A0A2S6IB25_9BACT|nr:outer membrane beta-barrel family protein [Neolewinella xylanilytica]PPK88711.1 outer membrane receptor protein involved in Fe transport [Neolewinella xylanilytica]
MRTLLLLGLLACAGSLPATALSTVDHLLSGRVVVAATGDALEYATVSAYSPDTTLVNGTVTGSDGTFQLTLPAGDYLLRVEFIGYAEQQVEVSLQAPKRLDDILIEAADVHLDAVEVTAERSRMNLSLDKKTFNVGQDLLARGGSANQLLEQLPSVTVSPEGAVSLRGNAGVKVLINGRPSALADNGALESIPAESIERVEIITNPSARYEAAGTAGIINIILKKDQQRGYGGTFSLTTGFPADHRANGNLNLRREKFTAFLTAGARYSNYRGREDNSRVSRLGETTYTLDRTMDQDRNDVAANAYAGVDYHLSETSTVSGSYSLYWMINDDEALTDFDYGGSDPRQARNWQQAIDYREPGLYQQLDFTFDRQLPNGAKLTAYLKNDLWEETERERSTFEELAPSSGTTLDYVTESREGSRDHLLQIDYLRPLGEGKTLEAGLRGETRVIVAEYLATDLLPATSAVLPGFANRLDYFERIGSAYVQYSREGEKIGYQLGLRNEFTLVRTENESAEMDDLRKPYNRLFPTANVTYTFTEGLRSQLSYSKRIQRPGFWQLNPFMSLSDPNGLFVGNPDLDPAYTDRLEINVVSQSDKLTLNPAVYASRTTDFFQFVVDYREANVFDLQDGTIVVRPVNLDHEDRLGLELTASYRPVEALTLTGEWNYFGYRQRGKTVERDFALEQQSWTAGARASVSLPGGFQAQASFQYSAPFATAQGTRLGLSSALFGMSKEWDKLFTLTLNVRSPRFQRTVTDLPELYESGERFQTGWRFGATLIYRFERGADSRERDARGNIR